MNGVIEEMDSGIRKCACNAECEELNFKVSLSQAQWPAKQYEVNRQTRLLLS